MAIRYKSEQERIDRFLSFVIKTNDCWYWNGSKNKQGYGIFVYAKYKIQSAHRFSYYVFNGLLKKGLYVMHKCDNPSCVNPAHLEQGTPTDNVRDAIIKKRFRVKRSSHHFLSKFGNAKSCKNGHDIKSDYDLYKITYKGNTSLRCKKCALFNQNKYYLKSKRVHE